MTDKSSGRTDFPNGLIQVLGNPVKDQVFLSTSQLLVSCCWLQSQSSVPTLGQKSWIMASGYAPKASEEDSLVWA